MSDINKEGDKPAYPEIESRWDSDYGTMTSVFSVGGMTIRQAYKMAALQGLLADSENMANDSQNAEIAGRLADAMLLEDVEYAKHKEK